MANEYTALIKERNEWWIGWIEEIPGVNCQEASYDDLVESLKITLHESVDAIACIVGLPRDRRAAGQPTPHRREAATAARCERIGKIRRDRLRTS